MTKPAKERYSSRRPRVSEVSRYEALMPGAPGRQARVSAFWTASWYDGNGQTQTRKFSVSYWGEDMARQKAQEMHQQQLRWAQALLAKSAARALARAKKKEQAQAAPASPPDTATEDLSESLPAV